jgi:hypothetical protein
MTVTISVGGLPRALRNGTVYRKAWAASTIFCRT